MADRNLTASRLREVLNYSPETGVFIWTKTLSSKAPSGKTAGSLHRSGYMQIRIDRARYQAHRLAWLHHYGEWPKLLIDHINGVKNDNRLSNLRDVDSATNSQNIKRPNKNNKSTGLLGAARVKSSQAWHAQITVRLKKIHLGTFKSPEEAHYAYLEAKRKLHAGCTI